MKEAAIIVIILFVAALTLVTDRENKQQQAQIAYQHKQIIELEKRIYDLENKQ